jgi:hypothetical protein
MFDLQQAIYQHLSANSTLMSSVTDIYDAIPQSAVYPYISFGTSTTKPQDTECTRASEETIQLDVWSNYQDGISGIKKIIRLVEDALHHVELSLDNDVMAGIKVTLSKVVPDTEGISHGSIQLKALVEHGG